MKNKELIEYLQGFPPESKVNVIILDSVHDLVFQNVKKFSVTDMDEPLFMADIDVKKTEKLRKN